MESDSSPIVGFTVSASFNGQWAAYISQTTPYLCTIHTHIGTTIKQCILQRLNRKTDN
jgi:hypothetical protein